MKEHKEAALEPDSLAPPGTLRELLQRGADDAVALLAPERSPLTYAVLRRQVAVVGEQLEDMGIGRGDCVAMVLPNGPEMAAAFLAVASTTAVAPLNPAYKLDELLFYLADLQPRALIVSVAREPTVSEAAARLELPLLELSVSGDAPAGTFALAAGTHPTGKPGTNDRAALPEDLALLLHTSGTTARPKLVPLSQRNLCTSATNVGNTLALTPADRCLNIMPLFHIHGLVGALLSTIAAGASIVCAPGFNAFRFFDWLREVRPTWYTAVPTMHQAIVQRAERHRDDIASSALRLIRSSSSPLAPQLMHQLETAFSVPVLESYGMTEGAHQICSNLLPPGRRQPGSVGVAAGPQVAVMNEAGQLLGRGEAGEVVIRGANVMNGYVGNSSANASAFTDGWFRTGDQGMLDADGYLTLTGRVKEIINRGGEKISPREIDLVLLDHPGVAQAVTFALPHPLLGEDVAAAIVLHPGTSADPQSLRAFAAARLADFKVPRKVIILDEIPSGPTGKPQRIGMAARLGLG